MAKYIDSNGLSYVLTKLKGYFSKIGHTHALSADMGSSVTVTAGTAASFTKKTEHVLSDATGLNPGTLPSLSVANGALSLSAGTLPILLDDSVEVLSSSSTFTANKPTSVAANQVVTDVRISASTN